MKARKSLGMNKWFFNIFSVLIIISMLAIQGSTSAAAKSAVEAPEPISAEQQQFDRCLGSAGISGTNTLTGVVSFVGTNPNSPIQQTVEGFQAASPEDAARFYLADCGSIFGLSGEGNELSLTSQRSIEGGRHVVRFQQNYQGIPVVGGEMLMQLTSDNNVLVVNGNMLPNIELDTQPSVDAATAQAAALQLTADQRGVGVEALKVSDAQLWIYTPKFIESKDGPTSLVWRMEVTPTELAPIRELVLINAHDGSVVLDVNQVDTALNRMTYTAGGGTIRPGTLVCNESDPNCTGSVYSDTDSINAHVYAGDTYNFYFNNHGRDSIDGLGMTLVSTVHYDIGYCNAFWDGFQMTYGDGCFIVVDDVVAHELTHGVTEYTSNLIYANQSGAINESFSDIWGEFVDQTNGSGNDTAGVKWLMGEDTSVGAIRNMQDPTTFGDPDRMGSPLYYYGTADNGGVHWNSGVGNKTAYLITDGGYFNGQTITGLGITKAAKIYYYVQDNLLISSSNYAMLGYALNQACSLLIGTAGITAPDCAEVAKATTATELNTNIPSIVTPIGVISKTKPTFRWSSIYGATQYRFQVVKGTATVYTKTLAACGGVTCYNTPTTALGYYTYKWRVQAFVGGAWQPYSAYKTFRVEGPGVAFNSQFLGSSAPGWSKLNGTWKVNGGSYNVPAIASNYVTTAHNGDYTKFTYEVRMKRTGSSGADYANVAHIRGVPTPLSSYNSWYSGYHFAYTNTGYWILGYWSGGNFYSLTGWQYSSKIAKNNWNTLKMAANGKNIKFYINGNLILNGNFLSGFNTKGKVGVGFYSAYGSPEKLYVDWATLNLTGLPFAAGAEGASPSFVGPEANGSALNFSLDTIAPFDGNPFQSP